MSQCNKGILFADISGTTQLFRKIGTSEAQHALERCVRRMERAIESCQGKILMPAVDEMIAAFPSADDAVNAAIEMQQRIADLPPASGVKLSIRIGVHFGLIDEANAGARTGASEAGRSLLNIAGPHQILTCAQTASKLSPGIRHALNSLEGLTVDTADGDCQVYELVWQSEPATGVVSMRDTVVGLPPMPDLLASTAPAAPTRVAEAVLAAAPQIADKAVRTFERYCLRINGKAYLVDERTPALTIGRDKTCDIVVRDRKASRIHVRLEKRGSNRFFLIDQSTNGTYVAVTGSRELKLLNDEMELAGNGRLAFGHSTSSDDAEVAEFEAM